jgi:hypothetical protein
MLKILLSGGCKETILVEISYSEKCIFLAFTSITWYFCLEPYSFGML